MSEESKQATMIQQAQEVLRKRADSLAQEAVEEIVADFMSVLLFRLSDEWYAVSVEDVREIYQEYQITPIPCVPEFVLGVVNIRGEIISVTDIARIMRIGSLATEIGIAPAIVLQGESSTTAIVVDEIGDIVDVPKDGVEPPLSTIDRTQAEFISGSLYVDGRLIGLINKERVLEPIGAPAK